MEMESIFGSSFKKRPLVNINSIKISRYITISLLPTTVYV